MLLILAKLFRSFICDMFFFPTTEQVYTLFKNLIEKATVGSFQVPTMLRIIMTCYQLSSMGQKFVIGNKKNWNMKPGSSW